MEAIQYVAREAMKMFLLHGVKAVRMDDIASTLGISKRTLYEMFGDKEQLIWQSLELYCQELLNQMKQIEANSTNIFEECMLLLNARDKEADSMTRFMEELRKYYPKIYDNWEKQYRKNDHEAMKKKLKQGVEQGLLLDNINFDLAIAVFTFQLYSVREHRRAMLPHDVSDKDAFRYIVTYFLRGMATEKGIKIIDQYLNENKK